MIFGKIKQVADNFSDVKLIQRMTQQNMNCDEKKMGHIIKTCIMFKSFCIGYDFELSKYFSSRKPLGLSQSDADDVRGRPRWTAKCVNIPV